MLISLSFQLYAAARLGQTPSRRAIIRRDGNPCQIFRPWQGRTSVLFPGPEPREQRRQTLGGEAHKLPILLTCRSPAIQVVPRYAPAMPGFRPARCARPRAPCYWRESCTDTEPRSDGPDPFEPSDRPPPISRMQGKSIRKTRRGALRTACLAIGALPDAGKKGGAGGDSPLRLHVACGSGAPDWRKTQG